MVRERYRLRTLEVGVAGHYGVKVLFRQIQQSGLKLVDHYNNLIYLVFYVHADIERHLVVPAACRVQLFAYLSHFSGKQLLQVHVDVLSPN
ncbi:MAG: hypothetical protein A4E55_01312 [Pelotomaculum sp. PtaU1.Bin035]|nr:MAG: hypothetical protein A4E55_01312 [Pelotomaculum sp. PtaU1.Bin035]